MADERPRRSVGTRARALGGRLRSGGRAGGGRLRPRQGAAAGGTRGRLLRWPSRLTWLAAAGAVVTALGAAGCVLALLPASRPTEAPARAAAAPLPPEASGGDARTVTRRSFLNRLVPPPEEPDRGSRTARSVRELVRRLPLERKVSQLLLFGFEGSRPDDPGVRELTRAQLGGIVLDQVNYEDPDQLEALTDVLGRGRGRIRPWVVAPQEGGDFSAFFDLPPAKAAADLASPAEAERQARRAARALRGRGLDGTLAPVVDVGPESGGALGKRAFSDDPEIVADYARRVVRAYGQAGLIAAPKHFPGLGGGSAPTQEGPATVGVAGAQLRARDLVPFRAALEAGAPAVVVGHGLYAVDDFITPASLSRAVQTGLLRRELRFRGVAITDDLAAGAVTAALDVPDAAVDALKAGADMVQISGPLGEQDAARLAVLNAVRRREIPRARVDEALTRVLEVKRVYGLLRGEPRRRPR